QTGTVTAVYNGDDCFTTSTGTADVGVNPARSAVSVAVAPDPSVCGETVTVCATVTAVAPGTGTPSGSVTFTAPGGLNETVPLGTDGTACATTTALETGTVSVSYTGDGCFLPSSGTTDVTVNRAMSAVSVTVDPNPSVCGQSVTVCATVTAVAPGTGTPTGTVTFLLPDGSTQIVMLDAQGTACLTTDSLGNGYRPVSASYSGDGCFLPSSGTTSVTVNRAMSAVSVAVAPNPSVCGEPVTVCATVTAVAPGTGTPTGTVTFTGPGELDVTVPVASDGTVCLITSSLAGGTYLATYNGDGCFAGSDTVFDATVNRAASAVSVTVDPNPSVCGEPVTVCATVIAVAPGSGTPSGSVTFTAPGGLNETVALGADGTACVATLALESGTVTAVYGGDPCFLGSTESVDVTVDHADSSVSVSVDPATSVCGQSVTVCATVTAVAPGSGTPTGTVTFTAPGGLDETVPLDAEGQACVTTATL
ncbi:Ig-like domain repeat protein, partial [Streptomyces cellostaticus]|uniref:Ig-like domain repeat protein n=1 Tax=Streptomyces cellostaticus TaxID=67285 RepID=UPI002027339C